MYDQLEIVVVISTADVAMQPMLRKHLLSFMC